MCQNSIIKDRQAKKLGGCLDTPIESALCEGQACGGRVDGRADLRLALNAIDKFGGPSVSKLPMRFASKLLSVLC